MALGVYFAFMAVGRVRSPFEYVLLIAPQATLILGVFVLLLTPRSFPMRLLGLGVAAAAAWWLQQHQGEKIKWT